MKTIYSTLLILGLASAASAQNMVVPVPGAAQVVNQGNPNGNGGTYWTCNPGGSTVSPQGNNNVIYADRTSDVYVDGNNNTIYSVSTGWIHVDGNNNNIYTNSSSQVTVEGNNNVVYAREGVTVTFDGNNNRRSAIGSLRFDYANAPGGGCAPLTALPSDLREDVVLKPNPVEAGELLTLSSDKTPDGDILLTDMQGRVIRSYEAGSQKLSLRDVPVGFYRVKFSVNEVPRTMPVVIQ